MKAVLCVQTHKQNIKKLWKNQDFCFKTRKSKKSEACKWTDGFVINCIFICVMHNAKCCWLLANPVSLHLIALFLGLDQNWWKNVLTSFNRDPHNYARKFSQIYSGNWKSILDWFDTANFCQLWKYETETRGNPNVNADVRPLTVNKQHLCALQEMLNFYKLSNIPPNFP